MKVFLTHFFLLVIILFLSCETVVEISLPPQEPRLVVNSFFASDSTWQVHLSRSQDILEEPEVLLVTDGSVEILSGGQVVSTLTHVNNGFYASTNTTPVPGESYTLRASAPGLDAVTATDIIPAAISVDNITAELETNTGFWHTLNASVSFTDPAQIKNYYHIKATAYDRGGYSIYSIFSSSDPIIIANNVQGDINEETMFEDSEAIFDDAIFDGETYTLEFEIPIYFEPSELGRVDIQLSTVSETFFKFSRIYEIARNGNGNPFREPSSIYSNIENGFGVFAGYNATIVRWVNP